MKLVCAEGSTFLDLHTSKFICVLLALSVLFAGKNSSLSPPPVGFYRGQLEWVCCFLVAATESHRKSNILIYEEFSAAYPKAPASVRM